MCAPLTTATFLPLVVPTVQLQESSLGEWERLAGTSRRFLRVGVLLYRFRTKQIFTPRDVTPREQIFAPFARLRATKMLLRDAVSQSVKERSETHS